MKLSPQTRAALQIYDYQGKRIDGMFSPLLYSQETFLLRFGHGNHYMKKALPLTGSLFLTTPQNLALPYLQGYKGGTMKYFLTIILFFFLAHASFAGTLPDVPHIVVSGEHELRVAPDILTLSLSISETGLEVAKARESVEERSKILLDSLGEIAIVREDISSARLQITPHYNWNNRAQIYAGTEVSRLVEVTLRDLSRYDDLIRLIIDAQVAQIHSTRLSSSQEKELREKALGEAISDGIEKARLMVAHLPEKIGSIYSISPQPSNEPFARVRYQAAESSRQSAFEPGTILFKESLQLVFYLVQEN